MTKLMVASSWPSTRGTWPGTMAAAVRSQSISWKTRCTGTFHSLATFSCGSACFRQ
jgi:hypothetical protein